MGKVRVGIGAAWIGVLGAILAALIVVLGNKTEIHIENHPTSLPTNDFQTIKGYCWPTGWGTGFKYHFYMTEGDQCFTSNNFSDMLKGYGKGECKDLEFHVQNAPGISSSWVAELLDKKEATALHCVLSDNETKCKSNDDTIVQVEEGKPILEIWHSGDPISTGDVAFSLKCRWQTTPAH